MSPREAMLLAIEEGKKGAGFVAPNPLVGCVILDRQFNLIGKGFHPRVGEGHAEVEALRSVSDQRMLDGAHVFVTLEPCAHEGRTPSCAKALAKLPIASVTYGLQDPNPLVSGQGAEILRVAGKKAVLFNDLQAELEELCEVFLLNMREKRPFVTLKAAITLDGKIAHADGSSKWITGEASREFVQYLRGCHDAVLAGVGTFLQDNPRLNARDPRFAGNRQRVVIVDPQGKSFAKLKDSALLEVRAPEDVYVITASGAKPEVPVKVLKLEAGPGGFAMAEVCQRLYKEGLTSLFVEGGAKTYRSLIDAKLADRLYLFIAPKVFGEGIDWLGETRPFTLEYSRSVNLDQDRMITGRIAWSLS